MSIINVGDIPINENLVDGTELARRLERLYAAFHSQNSNATRPPSVTAGGIWAKTVTNGFEVMLFDGTNDVKIGEVLNGASTITYKAGDIGIGTTDPTNGGIHLYKPSSPYVRIQDAVAALNIGIDTANGSYSSFVAGNGHKFMVNTGVTEAVRITPDANVGVGTNAPAGRVDSLSNGYSAFVARASTSGANQDVIGLKAVDSGAVNFANVAYQARSHVWGYNGSTLGMELTAGGVLSLPNGQIKFPVSQVGSSDPNTLDDYEEGGWSPTLGGTSNYFHSEGRYTKVGGVVTCTFDIYVGSIGTGSTFIVSGLPFTARNGFSNGGQGVTNGGSVGWFTGSATPVTALFPRVDGNSSNLVISGLTSAQTTINANNIFANNTRVTGCITYLTA